MRKCKKCEIEKPLDLFRRNGKWIKWTCKECLNAPLRTGKENTGRFKKGVLQITSRNRPKIDTGLTRIPRKGEKQFCFIGCETRGGTKYKEWKKAVYERDQSTCQHCGSQEKKTLHAHHIVAWEDDVTLRFKVFNGLTLCASCHSKEDRRLKPRSSWSKGKTFSEEHRRKLSEAKKGKKPWNFGLKKT
jgi:hypothetical protein